MGNVHTERSKQEYDLLVFGQEVLRQKRIDMGLTQTQMARLIGINQSTVWRTEFGRKPRDRAGAEAFAGAYRLSRTEKSEWFGLLYGYEVSRNAAGFVEYLPVSEESDDAVAEIERQPGGRFLYKGDLSVLLEPLDVVKERAHHLSARRDPRTTAALDRVLARRKQRQAVFRQQPYNLYRDIYHRRHFEHWVETGTCSADDTIVLLGGGPPTPRQLLKALQNMVDTLTEYRNYEAGFLCREDERLVQAYVEIKPEKAVLLQSLERNSNGTARVGAGLIITEPSTVEAHTLRFHDLWKKAQTDKAEVIATLHHLMRRVEQRV